MSAFLPAPSMIVVLSLSISTFLALPRSERLMLSSLMPSSGAITLPPVRIARSSSMALRRSPKPGAFTATHASVPRILLTTRVASASPSMSSAMITTGLPLWAIFSSTGKRSFMLLIFDSWMRISASSTAASMRAGAGTKDGERYPRSNCIPSTTSSWVSRPLASSTVITPSLPTFSMASAMIEPIVGSLFAEIVPTCAISFGSFVDLDISFNSSTIDATAFSMPRRSVIGSCPAATILQPSLKIARASTVAVVVPSPATSEVLDATSFTICAPMFSNLSSSWISLATVTPSLVTIGAPQDFSIKTLRPFGPRVTVTESARIFTPPRIFSRASIPNLRLLAAICNFSLPARRASAFDDAENVVFTKNQMLFAVELELGAGVLREEDRVACLDVEGKDLAVLASPRTDCDDLALLRLFLRGIGDDEAALGLLLFRQPLHDHPIMKRLHFLSHGHLYV